MTTVVLGWGLGVESSAILTRWLLEPDSRDFDLDDLVVLSALTGDEFARTHDLVETHLLPLLRDHQVRWVQVSRAGQSDRDGITVVDDSRSPTVSHRSGPWRLSDELAAAGTVPQYASGRRLCSIRAKGSVLDRWIDTHVDGPYRHVIGFNAEEMVRVLRDRSYSSAGRASEYPLVEWGWDRDTCITYLENIFGVVWAKSCCEFCPFRGGSTDELLIDWAADPDAAYRSVLLERRAMALNPAMTLFPDNKTAAGLLAAQAPELAAQVAAQIAAGPHDLVEVRRVLKPSKKDVTRKAPGWRAVTVIATGTEAEMFGQLARIDADGIEVDAHGIARRWHRRRSGTLPDSEWLVTVAPSGVVDKQRAGFEREWDAVINPAPTLFEVA
jgi:hypothetical protein